MKKRKPQKRPALEPVFSQLRAARSATEAAIRARDDARRSAEHARQRAIDDITKHLSADAETQKHMLDYAFRSMAAMAGEELGRHIWDQWKANEPAFLERKRFADRFLAMAATSMEVTGFLDECRPMPSFVIGIDIPPIRARYAIA